VQVILTTRQFNDFLSDSIKEDIQQSMTAAFRSRQSKYLPVNTYPGLDAPDPHFNSDLNACLSSSTRYLFRGLSARYAVARLAQLTRPPRDVKIIMADPTKPAAVDFRARHDAGSGDDRAFDEAKKKIIDGIHMAIAGAYLNRRKFNNIELVLTPIPHVDRVEICDSAIFVSQFSDEEANSKFPSSLQFGRESLIYQMSLQDCNSILSSPYVARFGIPGSLGEVDFLQMLAQAGLQISMREWEEMKQMFTAFQERTSSQIMPNRRTGG
jgi:hypothetical protein